jgi:hypothetical protein
MTGLINLSISVFFQSCQETNNPYKLQELSRANWLAQLLSPDLANRELYMNI